MNRLESRSQRCETPERCAYRCLRSRDVFFATRVENRHSLRNLHQSALAEIAEISAGRAFDKVDGEFKQADFPSVIDTPDDGA